MYGPPPVSSGSSQLRFRVNGSTAIIVKSRGGVGTVCVCACVGGELKNSTMS